MLFLLLACAAAVYLWQHAPALLMLLAAGSLLWSVVIPLLMMIPVVLMWGADLLRWVVNALPNWRWLTAESLVPGWLARVSFRHDWVFYGFLTVGTLALLAEYMVRMP